MIPPSAAGLPHLVHASPRVAAHHLQHPGSEEQVYCTTETQPTQEHDHHHLSKDTHLPLMCYCHYIAFNYFSSLEKWQVLPGHVQPRSSRAATDQDEEVDEEVFGERCGHQGAGQDVHLEPLHQQPLLH